MREKYFKFYLTRWNEIFVYLLKPALVNFMSRLFLLSLATFFIRRNGYTEFSVAIDIKSCIRSHLFMLMVTIKTSVAIDQF